MLQNYALPNLRSTSAQRQPNLTPPLKPVLVMMVTSYRKPPLFHKSSAKAEDIEWAVPIAPLAMPTSKSPVSNVTSTKIADPVVVGKGLGVQPPPYELRPTSHITYFREARRPSPTTIMLQGHGVDPSSPYNPTLRPNTPGWTVCGRGVHTLEKVKTNSSPNVANYSRNVGNFVSTELAGSSCMIDTGVVRTTRSPRHEPFLSMMRPMTSESLPSKEKRSDRCTWVRARSPFYPPPPSVANERPMTSESLSKERPLHVRARSPFRAPTTAPTCSSGVAMDPKRLCSDDTVEARQQCIEDEKAKPVMFPSALFIFFGLLKGASALRVFSEVFERSKTFETSSMCCVYTNSIQTLLEVSRQVVVQRPTYGAVLRVGHPQQ